MSYTYDPIETQPASGKVRVWVEPLKKDGGV
jgi:hypothetical protein